MQQSLSFRQSIMFLLALLLLAGCGSSSDDTSNNSASGNQTPVAIAGLNQGVTVGSTVLLDGSGSVDDDLDPLTYSWSFAEIPDGSEAVLLNSNTVAPSFVADLVGTYLLELVVNDGSSDSRANQVSISVASSGENSAPVIGMASEESGYTVYSSYIRSYATDADGDTLYYLWEVISAPEGSSYSIEDPYAYKAELDVDMVGEYVLQLTASDGLAQSTATCTVTMEYINVAPAAYLSPISAMVVEGMDIPLSASESSDANDDELTYSWSFLETADDSVTLSAFDGADVTLLAPTPGYYEVQMTVSDGEYEDSKIGEYTVQTTDSDYVALTIDDDPDMVVLPYSSGGLVYTDVRGEAATDGYYLLQSYTMQAMNSDAYVEPYSISGYSSVFYPILMGSDGNQYFEDDQIIIAKGEQLTLEFWAPPTYGEEQKAGLTLRWAYSPDVYPDSEDKLIVLFTFISD